MHYLTKTLLALTILFCLVSFVSCKKEKSIKVKPVEVTFKKEGELKLYRNDSLIHTLDIEIADDEYQTQTGLMYRNSMANNQGMLFIFPDEQLRSFYMKNTRIPLDIIYFDANKRFVSVQVDAKPFDETSLPSEGEAQYVLKVNGGLSSSWNLDQQTKIEFTHFND